jgi:hypothetical protein
MYEPKYRDAWGTPIPGEGSKYDACGRPREIRSWGDTYVRSDWTGSYYKK